MEELVAEDKLAAGEVVLGEPTNSLRIYRAKSYRNWKREASEMAELVKGFSPGTPLGDSIGQHGELMFDAAFAYAGFTIAAKNVSDWNGRKWVGSGHDLDRIYLRDGIAFGAEIKNTLKYIPQHEFDIKLDMCRDLRLVPLFITRFSPKPYNWRVIQRGGYAMLFKTQLTRLVLPTSLTGSLVCLAYLLTVLAPFRTGIFIGCWVGMGKSSDGRLLLIWE